MQDEIARVVMYEKFRVDDAIILLLCLPVPAVVSPYRSRTSFCVAVGREGSTDPASPLDSPLDCVALLPHPDSHFNGWHRASAMGEEEYMTLDLSVHPDSDRASRLCAL